MILYIIFYILFAFISQKIVYKYIKKIDKKERIKLQKWEEDFINKIIELRKNNNLEDNIEIDEEIEKIENSFLN